MIKMHKLILCRALVIHVYFSLKNSRDIGLLCTVLFFRDLGLVMFFSFIKGLCQ